MSTEDPGRVAMVDSRSPSGLDASDSTSTHSPPAATVSTETPPSAPNPIPIPTPSTNAAAAIGAVPTSSCSGTASSPYKWNPRRKKKRRKPKKSLFTQKKRRTTTSNIRIPRDQRRKLYRDRCRQKKQLIQQGRLDPHDRLPLIDHENLSANLVDGNGSKNDIPLNHEHPLSPHSLHTVQLPPSDPNQRTTTVNTLCREASPHNDSDQENMAPPVEATQRRYHLRSRSRRQNTETASPSTTSMHTNTVSAGTRSRGTKRRRERDRNREGLNSFSPHPIPSSSETTASDQVISDIAHSNFSKQEDDDGDDIDIDIESANSVKLECGRTHSSSSARYQLTQNTMTSNGMNSINTATLKREGALSPPQNGKTSRGVDANGEMKGEHGQNEKEKSNASSHYSDSYRFPANFEPKTKKIKLDPTLSIHGVGGGGSALSTDHGTADLPVLGEMNSSSTPSVPHHGNAVYPQLLHRNLNWNSSSDQFQGEHALDHIGMDTADGHSLRLLLQHLFPSFPSTVSSPPVPLGQPFGATMPALHSTHSTSSATTTDQLQVPGTGMVGGSGTTLDVNMQCDPFHSLHLPMAMGIGGGERTQINGYYGTNLNGMGVDGTAGLVPNWNSVPLNVFSANNVGSATRTPLEAVDALQFGDISSSSNLNTTSAPSHSALERLADYVIDDYNRNRESLGSS